MAKGIRPDLERQLSTSSARTFISEIFWHSDLESWTTLASTLTLVDVFTPVDSHDGASEKAAASSIDKNIVDWDGDDDTQNPQNWSWKRKWAVLTTVSCFAFIAPVSSSMIAPSLPKIAEDFEITSSVIAQLTLSIFILACAIGPMILGPLSEVYGRVLVLQLSNLFYFAFNLGCGFARTKAEMIAFRFFSGLGGSCTMAIGGGIVVDLFDHNQCGKAVSVYALAPLLGPTVGPVFGGLITQNATWRWVFWATCIADAIVQIAGLIFLRETYSPILLRRKCARLIQETGNKALHTKFDTVDHLTFVNKMCQNLTRPFRMLATQFIIQFVSIYVAYLFGLTYIVLCTFTTLWTLEYHQSLSIGSLNYMALVLGCLIAAQVTPRVGDKLYKRYTAKNNGQRRPEFRIPLIWLGSVLVPIGLLIYGWTAHYHTHWIGPDSGIFIFGIGVVICFQTTQIYLVDEYTRYAASALGAVNTLRSTAGFGFPLFGPKLYDALGYGWGNTLLAALAVVLGMPVPWILWRWGANLRARSGFAAG